MTVVNPIDNLEFCFEIFSDSSNTGWGACCNGEKIQGFWNKRDREYHINYLEILAAFFGLKSFAKNCSNCKILLRIDNTTAISYINRMGGTYNKILVFLENQISIYSQADQIQNVINIFLGKTNRLLWLLTLSQKARGPIFYAFPPFSIIGRISNKIKSEGGNGILVFP